MATLRTLIGFTSATGKNPHAGLIIDADGDLFGTTQTGGPSGAGTAFELIPSNGVYSLTTLGSFSSSNGSAQGPYACLTADAEGNLFGTTQQGGAYGLGSVFEIVKTSTGYAAPVTLVSFDHQNGAWTEGNVTIDAAGNLFSTTLCGSAANGGVVFELAKTATGYASQITTLAALVGPNGQDSQAGLLADAAGNLFGTALYGGANGGGTVFELANQGGTYTQVTLVAFNGQNGQMSSANLIADAQGNLFGTTLQGGDNNAGEVFEIAKTASGYASTPTILVSFGGARGTQPGAALLLDAAGNLFGTTSSSGAFGDGTVFEIEKSGGTYAITPTTLIDFNGVNGATPFAKLVADAAGNLFGTTSTGGASRGGTVFELTNTGFQVSATATPTPTPTPMPTPTSSCAYSIILDIYGSFSEADFPYFRLAVDGVAFTGPLAANTSSSTPIGFSLNLTDRVAHTIQIVSASDSSPAKFVTVQDIRFQGQTISAQSPFETYVSSQGMVAGTGAMIHGGTVTFSLPAAYFGAATPTPTPTPIPTPPTGVIQVGGAGNYTTIQQAIQAAERTGAHTILVNPGTYAENDVLGAADNGLSITTGGNVTLIGAVGITNAANISISGITFQGDGSNIAIDAVNSSALTIINNSFLTTGEDILLNGTINSTVSNNRMITTTRSAIEEANGANGNTIDSNLIDGVTAPDTIGTIWAHGALNGTITHNQITNTTGAAISLSDFYGPGTTATRNDGTTIAYNSVDKVDTQSQDSGAIYVLGRSQNPHTNILIKNNYVGATGSPGAQAVGIYLDDNASGVTVTQNIIRGSAGLSAGFQIHAGSNNSFTNNIFDLGPGQSAALPVYGLVQADNPDQAPQGSFVTMQNDVITANIFTTESPTPRNPAFADLTTGIGNVTISGNDYWAFSGAPQYVAGSGAGGDTSPRYVQPAAQQPSTLAGYGSWSGDGVNFQAIDTASIGLAPNGPHAY